LSDYTGDAIWQQAQPVEPFGYVLKPFEPRELKLVIEATLQQRGAAGKIKGERHVQRDTSSDNLLKEIIQRKKAEEQLRASEERFRRVISSISDHIYVTKVTADGTLHNLYLSPHVEVLTGYPIERFMADWNFWPSTVIHPDDRAVAAAQANQLIQGHNSEAEYRIIRADEQTIWVRDSGRTEREDVSTII
jgi:PAS domain S-box-containing protein